MLIMNKHQKSQRSPWATHCNADGPFAEAMRWNRILLHSCCGRRSVALLRHVWRDTPRYSEVAAGHSVRLCSVLGRWRLSTLPETFIGLVSGMREERRGSDGRR